MTSGPTATATPTATSSSSTGVPYYDETNCDASEWDLCLDGLAAAAADYSIPAAGASVLHKETADADAVAAAATVSAGAGAVSAGAGAVPAASRESGASANGGGSGSGSGAGALDEAVVASDATGNGGTRRQTPVLCDAKDCIAKTIEATYHYISDGAILDEAPRSSRDGGPGRGDVRREGAGQVVGQALLAECSDRTGMFGAFLGRRVVYELERPGTVDAALAADTTCRALRTAAASRGFELLLVRGAAGCGTYRPRRLVAWLAAYPVLPPLSSSPTFAAPSILSMLYIKTLSLS